MIPADVANLLEQRWSCKLWAWYGIFLRLVSEVNSNAQWRTTYGGTLRSTDRQPSLPPKSILNRGETILIAIILQVVVASRGVSPLRHPNSDNALEYPPRAASPTNRIPTFRWQIQCFEDCNLFTKDDWSDRGVTSATGKRRAFGLSRLSFRLTATAL